MKDIKFIFILMLCFVSYLGIGQNFVEPQKALLILETKKEQLTNEYKSGNLPELKFKIANNYFNVMPFYLKDGYDVPFCINIAWEKSREFFMYDQEAVNEFNNEISHWLETK
ncbi:MAG TPA: hypothetical protein PK047_13440 [Saprospiraceae bacterium]|nr:hypothetical protein [Saprospiraceae bacterium]HRP43112.1 hypothetical protein [Saprospiraceae bacterium]